MFADDFREQPQPKREQERYPQMVSSRYSNAQNQQPKSSQYNDNIMFGGQQDPKYFNNRANQMF